MQGLVDLMGRWGFVVLGVALVLVAFLVNRFAPHRRRRIRYAVFLFLLSLAGTGAATVLRHLGAPSLVGWAEHVQLVGDLLRAFTVVSLVTLTIFDVFLPRLGFPAVAITGDIVVGVAYLFAALGVLKAQGMTASSVVTTSAVVSGVLALSLQATLGNVIGGVALQLDGSVHVGDWVQLTDGTQGRVVAIRWRHTVVETRNWDTIIVPNSNLLAQNLIILGKRKDKPVQHRMWVYFHVDFRYPPSQVINAVSEALLAAPIPCVALDPPPNVICLDLAKDGHDGFANYAVRYWLTDLASDDPTSSVVRARIYSALKRAGIQLAHPTRTVFLRQDEDAPARHARHKEQRMAALTTVELFHALTADERSFVSDHLRYAPFTAGETCTRQGAVAHWLYVLTSGRVEVRRHVEGSREARTLAVIDAPSFFGEMGLMAGEARTADVVAATDVQCYRLDKPGLQRILEERPEIAEQFSRTLARRRVELEAAVEDLDEEARKARLESEQSRILDRIQDFFGLARTTRA